MFKHPRPLKRQPQLRSTSPALVFVSAPLASVPLLLRPFRICSTCFRFRTVPLCFYSALHLLATLYSPRVYISCLWQAPVASHCQYLCCGEHGLHFFFPAHPSPAFYHLNISPKQLIYSPGCVPSLFLVPLISLL